LDSTDAAVHGFATWDPKLLYNVLRGNYSQTAAEVNLDVEARHLISHCASCFSMPLHLATTKTFASALCRHVTSKGSRHVRKS
jgi:hypothetical protein